MQAAWLTTTRCCARRSKARGVGVFKHTGDGVCAAFGSPRSAVDVRSGRATGTQLPVRMGIATGEAELREGDYFGAVLNPLCHYQAALFVRNSPGRSPRRSCQFMTAMVVDEASPR